MPAELIAYPLKCTSVPAGREEIEALKLPVPEPLATLVLAVVGLEVVAQTIPLSVTVAPPSAVTFPPRVAFVAPTPEAAAVVTVGAVAAGVENKRKLSMASS
ncbi:hypothetical protein D3C86_1611310 [compost metagenome]